MERQVMAIIHLMFFIAGMAFGLFAFFCNKYLARYWIEYWYFIKGDKIPRTPFPMEEKDLQIVTRVVGALFFLAFLGGLFHYIRS
jgi:hypothetical protein